MQQSGFRPLDTNDSVLKSHERNARLNGEMRKPDVAVAMEELDQAISNLFDLTHQLLERLSPIIRQEPQTRHVKAKRTGRQCVPCLATYAACRRG